MEDAKDLQPTTREEVEIKVESVVESIEIVFADGDSNYNDCER